MLHVCGLCHSIKYNRPVARAADGVGRGVGCVHIQPVVTCGKVEQVGLKYCFRIKPALEQRTWPGEALSSYRRIRSTRH